MSNPTHPDNASDAKAFSSDGFGLEQTAIGGLSDEALSTLRDASSDVSIASGQTLFTQGKAATHIVCLLKGTVALHRTHGREHSTLLRLLDAGSTIGLDSAFGSGVYSNSAIALTDCSVRYIEPEALCSLMTKSPELLRALLGRLAADLQASDEARVNVVHLQVRARLAALLLALRDRHGMVNDSGDLVITLPLTRRDMASAIGTRPESLSRAIKALETAKVASFHGKRVVVSDLDDLLDEVEQ